MRLYLAFRQCVAQRCVEVDLLVEDLGGRFLIQPRIHRLRRAVHATPVGHHEAGILPVALQHLVEQIVVLAGPVAIELVVRAHHRTGLAALDRQFESQQVGFAHGLLANAHVHRGAPCLLVVQGKVLDGGHHVLAFDAADRFADHGAGQQRVFAGVFEVAAVARLAHQVGAAGQQHVEALGMRFAADHGAAAEGGFRIPGGGGDGAGRQRRGVVAGPHALGAGYAQARIAFLDGGNAQAFDRRNVTGGPDVTRRRRLVFRLARAGKVTADELEFVILRELLLQQVSAPVGGELGVAPCVRGCCLLRHCTSRPRSQSEQYHAG